MVNHDVAPLATARAGVRLPEICMRRWLLCDLRDHWNCRSGSPAGLHRLLRRNRAVSTTCQNAETTKQRRRPAEREHGVLRDDAGEPASGRHTRVRGPCRPEFAECVTQTFLPSTSPGTVVAVSERCQLRDPAYSAVLPRVPQKDQVVLITTITKSTQLRQSDEPARGRALPAGDSSPPPRHRHEADRRFQPVSTTAAAAAFR